MVFAYDGVSRALSLGFVPKEATAFGQIVRMKMMIETIFLAGLAMAWAFGLPVTLQVVRSTLRRVAQR